LVVPILWWLAILLGVWRLVWPVVLSALYVSVAPTIYASPPPAEYSVPSDQQPQAYPDPAFIERYGSTDSAQTSGEWVIVPGQHVNGIWVREHKVWVQGSR